MNGKSQLTALKLSINAEDNRIKLADKRRLYALFTVKVNEMSLALYNYSHPDDKSDLQLESDRNDLIAAERSTVHTLNEVLLIAPPDVGYAMGELHNYLYDHYEMAFSGERGIRLPDKKMTDLTGNVYVRMHKDLDPEWTPRQHVD